MFDLIDTIDAWRRDGQAVAIATVVGVEFSAPRDPGSALAVNERGEIAGSVSGGCVEAAVYEEARDAIATGRARTVSYGISDRQAVEVGLTCGGTIHVFIERLDRIAEYERVARALERDVPIALATRLDGPHAGAKLVVTEDASTGSVGSSGLDRAAAGEALALLAVAETAERSFGADGEPIGTSARVFIQTWAPKPEMLIFGAIDFSRAMATVGKYLGYRVVVVDARPIFATRTRIPDADDVVVAWPDEYLAARELDARTALVILTHDAKFDIPLLDVALRSKAGFIGAMGSRRTHANRIELLRAKGFDERDLARISAPVGLDIGARTPEETAISIAAEIVAVRTGRDGGRLRDGTLPVHATTPVLSA